MIGTVGKERMHPKNRFRAGYDFRRLASGNATLARFVRPNPYGDLSIDYANPEAVKALNRALLEDAYGLKNWDIPPGYLCPPVPGRSDYLHHIADLLAERGRNAVPRGQDITVLDIGMGANCIYPLIGASEYGWRFVGTEADPAALRWAMRLVASNRATARLVDCRLQPSPKECFKDVIRPGEVFDLSMCNPPFHASAAEAAAAAGRKQRNLGAGRTGTKGLNFGGRAGELWCPGGELGFVRRMIEQSVGYDAQCRWFTTLVSRSAHLPRLRQILRDARATEVRIIEMGQGQKRSRILAWTFAGGAGAAVPPRVARVSVKPGR
jgi:23S rRNA (adenine1618-N6)-methyltransferase